MNLISKLNIGYICFVFIWQACQTVILGNFDGAGRIMLSATIIILLLNILHQRYFVKNLVRSKTVLLKLSFFIYIVLNTIFLYDPSIFNVSRLVFIFDSLFVPFIIFLVTYLVDVRDLKLFLTFVISSLCIAIFIYIAFSSLQEGRLVSTSIHINEIILVNIAFLISILIYQLRFRMKRIKFGVILLLPIIFSVASGSRMGFGAIVILLVGYWITINKVRSFRFLFRSFILGLLSFFLINYIIDNTRLGERLLNTIQDSSNLKFNPAKGTVLEKFSERGIYYIIGWELFKKEPVFGVGLLNYKQTNNFICHVELIINLAELGIIGFMFYIFFYFFLFKEVSKSYKLHKYSNRHILFLNFVLFSILFCSLVLFLYNSLAISFIFGLILLLCKHTEYKNITYA